MTFPGLENAISKCQTFHDMSWVQESRTCAKSKSIKITFNPLMTRVPIVPRWKDLSQLHRGLFRLPIAYLEAEILFEIVYPSLPYNYSMNRSSWA